MAEKVYHAHRIRGYSCNNALRCYEQRSAEEVAALLGISITSVHTTYHRTRMKLETALADALCKHRKNSTNCCKILEVRTVFYNCAVRGLS